MPVCRYYLQGSCRFGDRCYYEHPQEQDYSRTSRKSSGYNDDYHNHRYKSGPSNRGDGRVKQDKYHWSNNNRYVALEQEEKSSNDNDVMFSTIKNDVKTWAESKMWPFSCYSYTKGSGCLDGLPDISPEEMRVLAVLHPSEYLNIVSEIESTYSTAKDEIFAMSDATKGNLLSQMNNIDNNPSRDLKISTFYGMQFNFHSADSSGSCTQSPIVHQSSFTSQSTSSVHDLSHSVVCPTPANATPTSTVSISHTTEKSQNISLFGSRVSNHSASIPIANKVYTKHDSLTDAEKKKFEAKRFTIGEIPTRPPSEQLCK